jgi:hypothetical protein
MSFGDAPPAFDPDEMAKTMVGLAQETVNVAASDPNPTAHWIALQQTFAGMIRSAMGAAKGK